jgi:hypothetical protein
MGKYYTLSGIVRELAIIVGVIMIVSAASATIYFGVTKEPERHSEVIVSEPVIEPVPVQELQSITEITGAAESLEDQLFRSNGHHLGQSVSWYRENVSGYKDMNVIVTAYDWKFMPNYAYHSDSWGRDWMQIAEPEMKYLFIFVNIYMAGTEQSMDPSYYIGEDPWSRWAVQINSEIITPDMDYVKSSLIKELENTYTLNDDNRVGPFGYNRIWDGKVWTAIPPHWLRMGKSNALDGYVIFQVPRETRPEDITILSQWDQFSRPHWVLT